MGIGFKELLIILAIALLIFGAKKIKTIGSDLGAAIRGFKKSMNEGEQEEEQLRQIKQGEADADFNSTAESGHKVDAPQDPGKKV